MKVRTMLKGTMAILVALTLLFSLCSCAKEKVPEDIIIGTWKATLFKSSTGWLPIDNAGGDFTFVFSPDGTVKITIDGASYLDDLTWAFDGSDDDSRSYAIMADGSPLTGVIYSNELELFVYSDLAFEKVD